MGTKRQVIDRSKTNGRFTPEAIALFKQLMTTKRKTAEYHRLNDALGTALKLDPWNYPAIVRPDEPLSYSPAEAGGEWERSGGPALFKALCQAAGIELTQ